MNYTIILSVALATLFHLTPERTSTIQFHESSKVTVQGTSTLHDWESVSTDVRGSVTLDESKNGSDAITALKVTVPVSSIKSGKSKMDEITYDAFNYKKHPNITFVLNRIEPGKNGLAIAHGTLSMAGATKNVAVKGKAKLENNRLVIDGEYPIDMTEYGMETPTAMLGTIKVGKDVNIVFHLVITK